MTFEAFHAEHVNRVHHVLASKLHPSQVDDAEQDVWLRVARQFDTRRPTRQWLNTIIRSVVIDAYRGTHADTPLSAFEGIPLPEQLIDRRSVADLVFDLMAIQHATAVLNGLEPHKRAVAMSYIIDSDGPRHSPAERITMHRIRRMLQCEA